MRIAKFGHSCLLVEDGQARVLLDPGSFSSGFEDLRELTAVLVTHQHADHLDVDRLGALLEHNPGAEVVTDEGTTGQLEEAGLPVRAVREGDSFDLAGLPVSVHGRDHAVIHPDIPQIPNVGFLLGGRLFHPGDAFTDPGVPVEVLAVPVGAPWMKSAEAVDYVRRLAPAQVIPVHEKVLAATGLFYGLVEQLGGAQLRKLDDGQAWEI